MTMKKEIKILQDIYGNTIADDLAKTLFVALDTMK